MKKSTLLWTCAFLMTLSAVAQAGPPVYNPCDPWLHPRPIPTPPPPPPGDLTTPEDEPETPPPVPNQEGGQVAQAVNPCGPTPSPSPSPTPPASPTPPPTPGESPGPGDPNPDFDPGQPFLEGSGKLGCGLNALAGDSFSAWGLFGLGLAVPLLWRRTRRPSS